MIIKYAASDINYKKCYYRKFYSNCENWQLLLYNPSNNKSMYSFDFQNQRNQVETLLSLARTTIT